VRGDLFEEGRVRQGIECHAEDRVLHRVGRYPILRWLLERAIRKNLENLARLAGERSAVT
jgi:hypothetical protein